MEKWLPWNIAAAYSSSFGAAGTGPGQFQEAGGIALDPAGNLWVIDRLDNRVEHFT